MGTYSRVGVYLSESNLKAEAYWRESYSKVGAQSSLHGIRVRLIDTVTMNTINHP